MKGLLSSLVLLVTLFGNTCGRATCDFDRFLRTGWIYGLKYPGYPRKYVAGSNCRWVVRAPWDQRVNITCKPFNLAPSYECEGDRLEIQDGDGPVRAICKGFTYLTKSSRLTVTLVTNSDSPGGSFRCTLEAEKFKTCTCGRKNAPSDHHGNETAVHEYPFMAAVIDNRTQELICVGTIINEKQVLTAAHCLAGRARNTFKVLVGAHDLRKVEATPGAMFLRTESYKLHENYNGSTSDYDIALITVDGKFKFTETMSPVCLPFQRPRDSFGHDFSLVLGWRTDHIVNGSINVLTKARVGVETPIECKSKYPKSTERHICSQEPNIDLCGLESGGPLTIQNRQSDKIVQIGFLTKPRCGLGADVQNFRVGVLIDWIVKNSPPDTSFCKIE